MVLDVVVFVRLLVYQHVLMEQSVCHRPCAVPLPCCRCEQVWVVADSTCELTLKMSCFLGADRSCFSELLFLLHC